MSCDAVAVAAFVWLASTSPVNAPGSRPLLIAVADTPPPSVAAEPLFRDIISRAASLKAETERFLKADLSGGADTLPGYVGFKTRVGQLSDLDMQGHVTLAQRGAKDDLKCILRGISQDLPVRLKDLEAAATPKARTDALREMSYLLRDNVEVITASPQPAA